MRLSRYEQQVKRQGFNLIIGVDEAGRGPLAGPVVAAAVALKRQKFSHLITDSKQMTAQARQEAFHEILDNAYVGVGIISEVVIDRINILQATYVAMTNAITQLILRLHRVEKEQRDPSQVCLLIDGPQFKSDLPYAYKAIIDGDEKIFSISCASIIAKVTRDRILKMYDQIYPLYGFRQHKGYATLEHRNAIDKHGVSLIHRRSFNWTAPELKQHDYSTNQSR